MVSFVQELSPVNAGPRVRAVREQAGMSQQVLATKAGVALRTLARIENGEDARLSTVDAIAAALGTTTSNLLAASSSETVG